MMMSSQKEQWDKVEQIYKLSLPVQLNKMQQQLLDDLKYMFTVGNIATLGLVLLLG